MQKAKRVILKCLTQGPADRFKLRKHFSLTTKPTNSSELMRQLSILEEKGCVTDNNGLYSITKKGKELLVLLEKVNKTLK